MEYTQINENKRKKNTHIQKYLQIEEINQILSDQYQKTRTEGREVNE